jgi:hypothetical protein
MGLTVGVAVGLTVGDRLGFAVGLAVGDRLRLAVGLIVTKIGLLLGLPYRICSNPHGTVQLHRKSKRVH